MAPVAAVDEGGVVGVDAGGDVGTGVGVDVVLFVLLSPQATSRTASNRLHIASADQRVKCFNRVNIKNFMRYTPKLPIVQFGMIVITFCITAPYGVLNKKAYRFEDFL